MTSAKQTAENLIGMLKKAHAGAEGRARVTVGKMSHTRFAVNEITTAGDTDDTEVSLTVSFGRQHATATTSRLEEEAHADLVERAVSMAKLSPEDPEWMGVLGPQTFRPSGPTRDSATEKATPELRAEAAKAAIAITKEKGVLGAGFFSTGSVDTALATSLSLVAYHSSTHALLTSTARTTDGTGSGWAAVESQRIGDVDARAVATRAADKALASQKPRELDPGKYTVVLEPAAVASLVGFLREAMDARKAEEGRSYFAKAGGGTRIGEAILAKGLSLRSDPSDPLTPGPSYDSEGFPLAPITWFESGTLKALARSLYWAKKTGVPPTGSHATVGLYGDPGPNAGVDQLVAKVDRGLLVTRFWYTRWLEPKTMAITGLTRDGVYLIEKGKITAPVANFRFNDSPARVLGSVTAWSNETSRFMGWGRGAVVRTPAIVAHEFNMASKSAAV
jgi:predicted Zn-dependent protease